MTALDENRAKSQLAKKAGVDVTAVTNLAIWGNHSARRMYPDFYNAKINGQAAASVISDEAWLKGEFISTVQQRGAAIIKARGLTSAASAANAAVDSVHGPSHADARRRLVQRLCPFRRQLWHRKGFDQFIFPSAATAKNLKSSKACRSTNSARQKLTRPRMN